MNRLLLALSIVAVLGPQSDGADAAKPKVDFDREIRPLLSENCFHCHGPDEGQRKADLRLDTQEGAYLDLGGYHAIVPGDASESEVYLRIASEDDVDRMPPPDSGRSLTPEQIAAIKQWIDDGAEYTGHWAFASPKRPAIPDTAQGTGVAQNEIDRFIFASLEREGLSPSEPADKTTLLRRVTFDLSGLPPTPEEVDDFLHDTAPDAYARVVDRLLASPRFGERMATPWLDAARYADTNGYQIDGDRIMWRWRDWVIGAFNRNLPFDQFTIDQIAGDMVPNPTLDQLIATGFNRNHRGNSEGGVIAEEYLVEYVVDRVDTTSTVWMGLTVACARCHDHKYDPIAQKEFYAMFSYFHNVPENGKAVKFGNSPPFVKTPTADQGRQLDELDDRIAEANEKFEQLGPRLSGVQAEWEAGIESSPPLHWSVTKGRKLQFTLDRDAFESSGEGQVGFRDGGPAFVDGIVNSAGHFDGHRYIDAGDVAKFGFQDKFSLTAWIYPTGDGTIVSRMLDVPQGEGFSLSLENGAIQANFVKRWLDDAIRVKTARQLSPNHWYHVAMTYDGSRLADGVRIFVNGEPQPLVHNLDELNQDFISKNPFRIGAGGGKRFAGDIDEVCVYDRTLTDRDAGMLACPNSINDIARIPTAERTPEQANKIRDYFLETISPGEIQDAWYNVVALQDEKLKLVDDIPTTMVMKEMDEPRETHVLLRGVYDQPGDEVSPGVPSAISTISEHPKNRLEFAQWLVRPDAPLTPRVAVNRYWEMLFGIGLVKTMENFGVQGERPSHPELLDWLATEFVRTGWDVKRMLRLIVTSSTYCQSSRVDPRLWKKDPENRLLARGPRFRLSAQMIRDQALAASGLLVERIGGPSVKPYQPAGLWEDVSGKTYVPDQGEGLYRRSMYTFWKRTSAPPSLMCFDAASRETCSVNGSRTNTPMQALTLLNDVTYVEASRKLAERAMSEGGSTPESRITHAFRLVTGRVPATYELNVLLQDYQHQLAEFQQVPDDARKLLEVGDSEYRTEFPLAELAAYAAISNLVLNLDEVVTKE